MLSLVVTRAWLFQVKMLCSALNATRSPGATRRWVIPHTRHGDHHPSLRLRVAGRARRFLSSQPTMFSARISSSLHGTCSSRAAFRQFQSGTRSQLSFGARSFPQTSQPRTSTLSYAKQFSSTSNRAGFSPKSGLRKLTGASALVGIGLGLSSLNTQRPIIECEGKSSIIFVTSNAD